MLGACCPPESPDAPHAQAQADRPLRRPAAGHGHGGHVRAGHAGSAGQLPAQRRTGRRGAPGVRHPFRQPLRLPRQAAGRCAVAGNPPPLPRIARRAEAVLHPGRHHALRRLPHAPRRRHQEPAARRRVRHLHHVREARGRARGLRQPPAGQALRLQHQRHLAVRPRRRRVGRQRRRARQGLAQLRQERRVAPEAGRPQPGRNPQDPGQALRRHRRARARAARGRRVRDVHERLRHVH